MMLRTFIGVLLCGVSALGAIEAPTDAEIEQNEKVSMLFQSDELAHKYSGERQQWLRPYGMPEPALMCTPQSEKVCQFASAWLTIYPRSMIVPSGSSVLGELDQNGLWEMLEQIGINVLHTGPMKLSGQLVDGKLEPSVDGGFDRIGYEIDPLFGTRHEYVAMVKMAAKHHALIAGDLVPGHTGKGPDFWLALRNFKDYPGIFHMVEIDKKDWGSLPVVPKERQSVNLSPDQVDALKEKEYIIGQMDKVYFYDPKVKLTNWSVTPEIMGVDGKIRRWVYLHMFKEGQPSLNWLDPTFGANRIVAGDIVISLGTYGAKLLRLDANAFLGEEIVPGQKKAFSYGHPLSLISSDLISMMTRKLGGFTFQELDASIPMVKAFMEYGPDLSYDFLTRGAYMNALTFQNADVLRLVTREMMAQDLQPNRLIHALQNHDEFNFSYNFMKLEPNKLYNWKGAKVPGNVLGQKIMDADIETLASPLYPYNTRNDSGVSSTILGMAAAALGIADIYKLTPEEKTRLKNAHLLVTFYNAMQPGVFAISAWDLLGAFPLSKSEAKEFLDTDGDTRWLNRGGYDLMGENPDITQSVFGLPRAQTLYAPLPIQLAEECSYASLLKKMLAAREKYGVPHAKLIAIPDVSPQLYVALYRLPKSEELLMVAMNFGQTKHAETLSSNEFVGKEAYDIVTEKTEQNALGAKGFQLMLEPFETKAILFKTPETKKTPEPKEPAAPLLDGEKGGE